MFNQKMVNNCNVGPLADQLVKAAVEYTLLVHPASKCLGIDIELDANNKVIGLKMRYEPREKASLDLLSMHKEAKNA